MCNWIADVDNIWDTQCGSRWELTNGTLEENDMRFCPNCGEVISEESD